MPQVARTVNDADETTDLLVVGSGTGLLAALAATELGLNVLVIEKSEYVGGSTARSGGAFWIPGNPILEEAGGADSAERAARYLRALVADSSPEPRWRAFLDHGPDLHCLISPPETVVPDGVKA